MMTMGSVALKRNKKKQIKLTSRSVTGLDVKRVKGITIKSTILCFVIYIFYLVTEKYNKIH